jgi:hypothetical protein
LRVHSAGRDLTSGAIGRGAAARVELRRRRIGQFAAYIPVLDWEIPDLSSAPRKLSSHDNASRSATRFDKSLKWTPAQWSARPDLWIDDRDDRLRVEEEMEHPYGFND